MAVDPVTRRKNSIRKSFNETMDRYDKVVNSLLSKALFKENDTESVKGLWEAVFDDDTQNIQIEYNGLRAIKVFPHYIKEIRNLENFLQEKFWVIENGKRKKLYK